MGRTELHSSDDMLDAARRVVLTTGVTSATVRAIAHAAKAPMGAIYHRFGSRDALFTAMWVRAVRRSQAAFLKAIAGAEDPFEGAVAAAMTIFDFCIDEPEDARLIVSLRREDLLKSSPSAAERRELENLNKPVGAAVVRLAEQIFGSPSKAALETVLLATFDLPYGAVRRHLRDGRNPPRSLRARLEAAVRAALRAT
jgi:AcrR family transcriptional regulator